MRKSRFSEEQIIGVHLLATGGHAESARSMGVHTDCVKLAAYAISGLCAGPAAILLVARIGSSEPTVNTNLLLNSVAAVVLGGVSLFGGRGSILGPVIGTIILTTLVNGQTLLGVSAFYQPLAVGLIVVLAALARIIHRGPVSSGLRSFGVALFGGTGRARVIGA